MKKCLIVMMALIFAGCTSTATYTKNAQSFAEDLSAKGDPVEVIDIYQNKYKGCDADILTTGATAAYCVGVGIYTLGLGVPFVFWAKHARQGECIQQQELAEPGTDFKCINQLYKNEKYYKSDKCILYRRDLKKSDVNYFDYKRFLSDDSPIKTDADFLKLVEYYNKIDDCDKKIEATTDEKTVCKDTIKNNTRMMANHKVNCKTMYADRYTEELHKQGRWFDWAIDHDPYANVRMLRAMGEYTAANFAYNPEYSRSDAIGSVENELKRFGKENLCDISGWKSELRKLGYGI